MGPDDISRFHQILEVRHFAIITAIPLSSSCFRQVLLCLSICVLQQSFIYWKRTHCLVRKKKCLLYFLYYPHANFYRLRLQARMREVNKSSKVPKYVRRVELVQKRSIMYYQQEISQPFLKIVVALPTMVTSCRGRNLASS